MRDIEKLLYNYGHTPMEHEILNKEDKAILINILEALETELRHTISKVLDDNLTYQVVNAQANGIAHIRSQLINDMIEGPNLKEHLLWLQTTVLLGLDLPKSKMYDFIRIWHELPSE